MTVEIDGANNTVKTNTVDKTSGSTLTIGGSGTTVNISGTAGSGFPSVGGATGVDFNDNVKARFGTGNDLEIFHDGNSIIRDGGSGSLVLRTNNLVVQNAAGNANIINAPEGASGTDFSYNGSVKLQVESYGINVNGAIKVNESPLLTGGNYKLFEGTFGSQTSGTISLSSIGFTPKAVHCIFAPNDTTNAKDVDNISIGFGVKTGSTSSDMAVAYNYFQQSGASAFDASPNVIGRLAFGGGTFSNLTITAWNNDDCTVTKLANGTPTDRTLKYAIMVTG